MRTFRDSDISLRPEICPKSVPSIAYRSEFEREALRSDAGPGIQGADRPRLPGRGQATTGVVRALPAARRPRGAQEDRPGVDGARKTGGRLLHETHGRGVAERPPRPGAPR